MGEIFLSRIHRIARTSDTEVGGWVRGTPRGVCPPNFGAKGPLVGPGDLHNYGFSSKKPLGKKAIAGLGTSGSESHVQVQVQIQVQIHSSKCLGLLS